MSSLDHHLALKLSQRKEEGLLRSLRMENTLVDFCSNDYLGLARSSELAELIKNKTDKFTLRNGATGSRLISGNSELAEQLEIKLAAIFHAPASLIFNSGYAANMAVLSSLPQRGDTILYDELAHASMRDGARLSLATRHPFRHNDISDLENKIKKSTGNVYIAVESVYSMDGDKCPLKELVSISKNYGAFLILDEAHSTGVYGTDGSGLAVAEQVSDEIDVRIYTFGKAMGVHGACVVGSHKLREYLINFARPFIYTTALPPHNLIAIDCAFHYLQNNVQPQTELFRKINLFLENTQSLQNQSSGTSAIQTAIFEGNRRTKEVASSLQAAGYDIRPILSPTVPKNKERLRICIHSYNTDKDITEMAKRLVQLQASSKPYK